MQVFETFLKTLTESGNRSDRQAFSRLLPDVRTVFYRGFNEIVDYYGADRRVIEADLAVLGCLRLLWELVPSPLFATNDVDYEGLARRTWAQTTKSSPSDDVTRGLSVVYRRLRQYLIGVRLWKFTAHGVTGLNLLAPVQHFFPVGLVTHLGSFDQHVGVAGLPVGTSSDIAPLFILRLVEKFEQHRISGVEKIFR